MMNKGVFRLETNENNLLNVLQSEKVSNLFVEYISINLICGDIHIVKRFISTILFCFHP